MSGGRPTDFTEAEGDAICEHVAAGRSVLSYCRETGRSYTTVMGWLRTNTQFENNYARAREDAADADADMVTDIRDRCVAGEIDPHTARVAVDAAKWSAGVRKPKRYGSKVETTLVVDTDTADALTRARGRVKGDE